MNVILPRNTSIPNKKTQIFSIFEDNQTFVNIEIYEGEREFTKDNRFLGTLNLDGINPMPKGKPQIEITFNIDSYFRLEVIALEKLTGKINKIFISKETRKTFKKDNEPFGSLLYKNLISSSKKNNIKNPKVYNINNPEKNNINNPEMYNINIPKKNNSNNSMMNNTNNFICSII